jgi:hypothetical protein
MDRLTSDEVKIKFFRYPKVKANFEYDKDLN